MIPDDPTTEEAEAIIALLYWHAETRNEHRVDEHGWPCATVTYQISEPTLAWEDGWFSRPDLSTLTSLHTNHSGFSKTGLSKSAKRFW